MLGKGLLPKGGATINTVAWDDIPRRHDDGSLRGWAQVDAAVALKETLSIKKVDLPDLASAQSAIVSDYDVVTYSHDDQKQHCTSVHWQFRDKLFATHLVFLSGDAAASSYVQTLLDIVGSVRPI
jgi:hypothetical protein